MNINLIFFITTKGHFGRRDLYQYTIKNLRDSINLSFFNCRKLSIKKFLGDDEECNKIIKDLPEFSPAIFYNTDPRINDDSPVKDYGYYLLTNYLHDICNIYSDPKLLNNEYTYIVEDDSPAIVNNYSLEYFIKGKSYRQY